MKQLLKELGFEELPMMTDFFLSIPTVCNPHLDKEPQFLKRLENIHKYAVFIRQPLTKGMFVPCSEGGEVLEKPLHYDRKMSSLPDSEIPFNTPDELEIWATKCEQYQQAKDRVLFDGWHKPLIRLDHEIKAELIHVIHDPTNECLGFSDNYEGTTYGHKTIEQAINNGVKLKLK